MSDIREPAMNEYVSPIDRHRHYGEAARASCAVCLLEAERDRLRAVVDALREYVTIEGRPVTPEVLHAMKGAWARVHETLDQLDGSQVMGGHESEACPFVLLPGLTAAEAGLVRDCIRLVIDNDLTGGQNLWPLHTAFADAVTAHGCDDPCAAPDPKARTIARCVERCWSPNTTNEAGHE
jgi:hypothetical protein